MPTPTLPVGADIESLCNKCGDVWHVVVAKVGDRIAKVQCKQCGVQHRHRPPGGAERPAKASAPRARKAAAPRAAAGPTVEADLSRPPRAYRATESFAPGDRVEHATFGAGVVEASPGPGKIQVFFPGGRRILAVAKAAPALGRPPILPPDESISQAGRRVAPP